MYRQVCGAHGREVFEVVQRQICPESIQGYNTCESGQIRSRWRLRIRGSHKWLYSDKPGLAHSGWLANSYRNNSLSSEAGNAAFTAANVLKIYHA